MEHLQRDRPIVPTIMGQPDGSHAAASQLSLEAVAVGQGGLEAAGQGCGSGVITSGLPPADPRRMLAPPTANRTQSARDA